MERLDFSDIDTLKAFFVLLLGAAAGAILVYIYDSSIAPHLASIIPARPAVATSTGANI